MDGRHSKAGVALLTALGMLLLFTLLGGAYVRYMGIELERANYQLRQARVRQGAAGGVRAAMAEIQARLDAGQAHGDMPQLDLPRYQFDAGPDGGSLVRREARQGDVVVSVTDECAKIDLNHAPRKVIEAIPGFDRAVARKIKYVLPRDDETAATALKEGRSWLTDVDDLLTRELMDENAFAAVNTDLVTVLAAADHNNPVAYLNLNSAPAEVIGAALNLTPEAAQAFVAARPFGTAAEVLAAAGKPAEQFNIPPGPDAIEGLPSAFCLVSRCLRISSGASLSRTGGVDAVTHSVEAVVYFPRGGTPEIRYWKEK